jgi:cell division septation protein DedD
MENNSTGNGDKRSWRDRLGIGTKELPRIAEEFKAPAPAVKPAVVSASPLIPPAPAKTTASPPPPGATKPAPKISAVVKPAPMAPRAAAKPAKVEPKLAPPEGFSDRLKAQREAAEKLAEQRVKAARQRAEDAAAQRVKATEPVVLPEIKFNRDPVVATDAPRPKFSFAESEVPNDPAPKRAQSQVTASVSPPKPMPAGGAMPPPRPALGIERPPLPPRPATSVPPIPQSNGSAPFDQVSNYSPPPPVFPSRAPLPTGLPPRAASGPDRPPYYNNPLPPLPDDPVEDPYNYASGTLPPPPVMRTQRPPGRGPLGPIPGGAPGPIPNPVGGYGQGAFSANDDIFERPIARPPRRVTAGEYQNAYRDSEMGYGYEEPRSKAPWLLAFLVGLTAIASVAGVLYYNKFLKPATVATGEQTTAPPELPIVKPPVETKTVPEATQPPEPNATDNQQPTEQATAEQPVVPATTKKEIYDRIVGDREVLGGQIVPTEELPTAPGDQPQQQLQGTTGATSGETVDDPAVTDQEAPLPLPPPTPGGTTSDQQGSLDTAPAPQPAASAPSVSVAAADTTQAADPSLEELIAPVPGEAKGLNQDPASVAAAPEAKQQPLATSQSSNGDASQVSSVIEPPPASPPTVTTPDVAKADTDPASSATEPATTEPTIAALSEQATAPDSASPVAKQPEEVISDSSATAQQSETTQPPAVVPKKAPPRVAQKPVKKVRKQTTAKSEAKPLVLVPEKDTASSTSVDANAASNVLYGDAPATSPTQTQKRRTLVDLLNGNKSAAATTENDQVASIATPQKPVQPVVAQQPQQKATPAQQTSAPSTGGFVVQLASFRTQDEANKEFARIRSRHPAAVAGLSPVVNKTVFAGSTRYRLSVGPTPTRAEADRICAQLLAEGERDCVAKSR